MKTLKMATAVAAGMVVLAAMGFEDPWMQMAFDIGRGAGPGAGSYDGMADLMNAQSRAIEDEDWDEALSLKKRFIAREYWGGCDVNKASDQVELALLYWNTGDRSGARNALSRAISIMRNGNNLGNNCWSDASTLYRKMQSGDLPSRFASKEFTSVLSYVMEVPMAQFNKTINSQIRQYDLMIRRMDSEIKTLEFQGQIMEHRAKFKARQDYFNATGRTFNPSNPPEYGTSARDEWNAAKRIYDIFGK